MESCASRRTLCRLQRSCASGSDGDERARRPIVTIVMSDVTFGSGNLPAAQLALIGREKRKVPMKKDLKAGRFVTDAREGCRMAGVRGGWGEKPAEKYQLPPRA